MRIATWNLERGRRSKAARKAQGEVLAALGADVVAITEPPPEYLLGRSDVMARPAGRASGSGEELPPWVAISGPHIEAVELDAPHERMAVAARARAGSESVIVYCAVLPWLAITHHAPTMRQGLETSEELFERVLAEQVRDIDTLRRLHSEPVIWAGDFNQSLVGSTRGGSAARRAQLAGALASLGYAAWNASAAHAVDGLSTIDLICGPSDQRIIAHGRIAPSVGDLVMSDHAGYWIDI